MATCVTCRFFDPIIVYETDEPEAASTPETVCRRYPPLGEGWPTVFADDWCGEWAESLSGGSQ